MKKTRIQDIVLAVTYKCNSRCVMCNIWKTQNNALEIRVEDLASLPRNLKNINITGGEPFLLDNLVELLGAVVRVCPKAAIIISSNGFATELILENMKRIIELKPNIGIAISIDGIGEAHDRIRGVEGGYNKVIATVNGLKKLGVKYLKIAFTIGDYNYNELPKVYRLAEKLGAEFSLALVHGGENYFQAQNVINKKTDIAKELDWLIAQELSKSHLKNWARAYFAYGLKYFLETGERLLPDYSGELNIFITPDGSVYANDVANEKIGEIAALNRQNPGRKFAAGDSAAANHVATNWMVCTARQAIKKHWLRVGCWILKNKICQPS